MARKADQLPNYYWIKLLVSYLDNREFMQMDDVITSIFIKLYLLAAKADSGGLIADNNQPLDIEGMAWFLRRDQVVIEKSIDRMIQTGFITKTDDGFEITRFMEEQGPGMEIDREQWRIRQAKSRARRTGKELPEEEENQESDLEENRLEKEKEKEEIKIKRVTRDNSICHSDNENQSNLSFFNSKLLNFFDYCFDINDDEMDLVDVDYWVDQYKQHGTYKLFSFWNWARSKDKTFIDAYQINKKKNNVKGWKTGNINGPGVDDNFGLIRTFYGEDDEGDSFAVYHRGKHVFTIPEKETSQVITFDDNIQYSEGELVKERQFFVDGVFEKAIPWEELGLSFDER